MRILKVTQAYHPFLEKGGPAFKVRALAERLAQRGHQVTVLTASLGESRAREVKFIGGVEVIYLRVLFARRSLTLNTGLISFCRERLREFDAVHIYGLYDLLGPVVAFFCRRYLVPYVVEPLGMHRPIDRSFRLKRLWHTLFGMALLRNASMLIATSHLERRELLDAGFPDEKVAVRYNGLSLPEPDALPERGAFRSRCGLPSGEPLVLFLGRLIPRKGADLLIEAFAQVCPSRGRLVIAGPEGEAGYVEGLKSLARALQVESRVLFAGPLYDAEKAAALGDADVFALPSRYENFGNAAGEAIACGTPVIVTDRCGISELVTDRAGLVIPYDRQALADALRRLLEDRNLYERLRAGCRPLAQMLSWDRLVDEQTGIYQRATGKQGLPAQPAAGVVSHT